MPRGIGLGSGDRLTLRIFRAFIPTGPTPAAECVTRSRSASDGPGKCRFLSLFVAFWEGSIPDPQSQKRVMAPDRARVYHGHSRRPATGKIRRFGRMESRTAARPARPTDLGLRDPPLGRATGHSVFLRPCRNGLALGDRHDELIFRALRQTLRTGHGLGHGGEHSTAPPLGPAHGSQPGAQAGRHALEGREMWVATLGSLLNSRDRRDLPSR